MLTPIPMSSPLRFCREKRANCPDRYAALGPPGAPSVPLPADAGPRARDTRRRRGVSPRSRDPDADDRLLAAQSLRGVSRRAIRAGQTGLRPVAPHEVGLELRARVPTRGLRDEDPPPPQDAVCQ